MKIKLRTLYASPAGIIQPDQVVNLPDAEATVLVKTGHAFVVTDQKKEAADAPKKERAVANRHLVEKADADTPQA